MPAAQARRSMHLQLCVQIQGRSREALDDSVLMTASQWQSLAAEVTQSTSPTVVASPPFQERDAAGQAAAAQAADMHEALSAAEAEIGRLQRLGKSSCAETSALQVCVSSEAVPCCCSMAPASFALHMEAATYLIMRPNRTRLYFSSICVLPRCSVLTTNTGAPVSPRSHTATAHCGHRSSWRRRRRRR